MAELTACVNVKKRSISLSANATTSITLKNGLLTMCSTYHTISYGLFFVTSARIIHLGGYNYNDGSAFSFSQSGDELTIKNEGSAGKSIVARWIEL